MADSFQKEKPPARINLFLESPDGDEASQFELPMRMLVMGDYTQREDETPVEDRDAINVNADNFESVLRDSNVALEYNVPSKLGEEGDELKVDLKIKSMEDFRPEQVARQVPELSKMLAMRNLLQDLRNRVVSTRAFRKELEQIVTDESALAELAAELDRMVAASDGAPAPDADSADDKASA